MELVKNTTWRSKQDFKPKILTGTMVRRKYCTEPRSKGIGRESNIYSETMVGTIPAVY